MKVFSRGYLAIYFSLDASTIRIRDALGYEAHSFRIGNTDVFSLSSSSVYTVSGYDLDKLAGHIVKRVKLSVDEEVTERNNFADPFAREASVAKYMLTGAYPAGMASENAKRAFRRLAERRVMVDGKIKLISKSHTDTIRLLEIPQSISEVYISYMHVLPN